MRTKIQRWGNSLAVRIPKAFAEEAGLRDESTVDMRLVEGGVLLQPLLMTPPTMEELLAEVTETNVHHEIDSGPAQGLEAW